MAVSTGCTLLDTMLNGGIPDQRAVLVTGGPGVGKSTLAMQFLQEGLENGDSCLYISTEQTNEELQTSFDSFTFDLNHPDLTITSIHATPKPTLEESESDLAIATLDGGDIIDGPFAYPFEDKYLIEYLEKYSPCDRIVFDSISGLAAISDNENRIRHVVLDLIRLFSDTFEATTIFTAEALSSQHNSRSTNSTELSDMLQFQTNGVIRLFWKKYHGSRRRFLQVEKMRGVDHDTRSYELGFTQDGIYLAPANRTSRHGIGDETVISTQLDGLDELCGGLVRGHSVLLEYDGSAMIDHLVAQLIHAALSADMCVWLITSPLMESERLDAHLPGNWDLEQLLDDNLLFVMDMFSAWKQYHDHRNVFYTPSGLTGKLFRQSPTISFYLEKKMAQRIDRRRDKPMFGVAYTEALLRWLEPEDVKESYYWSREQLAMKHDTGMFIHNPATMPQKLAEFFYSDSVQVFEAMRGENGIQYLHVNKSPIGQPGSVKVLDYAGESFSVK